MSKQKKTVYVALSADILNKGHVNVLKKASSLGEITVGLLTDTAVLAYKNLPYLDYESRKLVIDNLKYVKKVIPQKTLDYRDNLNLLKPDYVVHGDDWKSGKQKIIRKQVINILKKWNGKLVEVRYTKISKPQDSIQLANLAKNPENRRARLVRLLKTKKIIRVMEAHSALSALIVENSKIKNKKDIKEFDGIWSSSLTDSTIRGKPDNQSVDFSSRIDALNDILDTTTKPIIFDADNGGQIQHLPYLIKKLDRIGVSAVIIEDKIGLKKNSLFKNQVGAKQDSIKNFSKKLKVAKKSKLSNEFLIIARIESLILGKNVGEALKRARSYSKAGADCIMIHSNENSPDKIFKFCNIFKKDKLYKPIVAVPSSYNKVKEEQLERNGCSIVIYANHLLRASYPAMKNVAEMILKKERSFEASKKCISIKEILNLIK